MTEELSRKAAESLWDWIAERADIGSAVHDKEIIDKIDNALREFAADARAQALDEALSYLDVNAVPEVVDIRDAVLMLRHNLP